MPMSFGGISKSVVATKIVAADGSGDYTDIQTAIDTLPATGGVVYIKEGNYTLSDYININKSNTGIKGAGRSTMITTIALSGFKIGDVSNVLIEGLTFTGSAGLGSIHTSTGTPKEVTIKDCYFYDIPSEAINVQHGSFLIEGCFFSNVGRVVAVDPAISFGTTKGVLNNNIFTDCPYQAVVIHTTANENIISNNIFSACGDYAIHCNGDQCLFLNNLFLDNSKHGLSLYEANECIASGNVCKDNGYHGIRLARASRCVISDNICVGNDSGDSASYDGIFLEDNSDNNIISGNRCAENDRYEINISADTCDKNLVHGNHCIGTDHEGAINDVGTGTTSADNVTI